MIFSVDEVVERYADHIYRAAYSYLGSAHEAEDVVSDVLMKYFSVCMTLDIESAEHLKAWLLRTAVNRCKDIVRSARWKKSAELTDIHKAEFAWSEKEIDVKAALDSLTEKYRIVVYLYYYEEYKTEEIAEILRLPKGTVVSRLDRARRQLRNKLADYGEGL
ncbi:RNA polymerase sigma factor [uncultured Ruminococcus sp.]|uniref:RNA polymerase sigma factor n=1 Tax=uncultured Ruminococcus sp. TaxID=165186 RepID=UPI0025EDF25C|nr:sigma-70 family RNA polymerase sigma factor [uncultured Ruminococcus sp.]